MFKIKLPKPLLFNLHLVTVFVASSSFAYSTTQVSTMNATSILDNNISLAQITKDVTFLASDKLKGRGNFTKDINKAANFIAKRFNEVGLRSPDHADNYQQSYSIKKITPNEISVTINNDEVAPLQLTMATNQTSINWLSTDKSEHINSHVIGKEDNVRDELQEMNVQGGQHLVILHSSHRQTFKRYQSYFSGGITKLVENNNDKQSSTIVMALSDIKEINSFKITASANAVNAKLTNVIGILPGKSKINEIVLYTAHYDHLGERTSVNTPNEVFNGADDDASGVSAIINLANHFAKTGNNERTLMFAAFSAEELGGFGSRYFSKQLNAESISAMINIEMIGKPAKFGAGTVWMTGMERSTLGKELNLALTKEKLTIYADPYPKQNLFYRSDNATLARLGVPAHSFSSTQLDKDKHYHQVSDDINSLDLHSMHQVIKTLAIATTPLVTGEITPSRIDPSQVTNNGLIF